MNGPVHWADHLLWIAFGPSTWGAGGNMLAWVICGAIGGLWLRAKLHAHHLAQLAQAERHHLEQMAQAQAHHNALVQQANQHHLQALERADAHLEALKAHVTAAGKRVVPGSASRGKP